MTQARSARCGMVVQGAAISKSPSPRPSRERPVPVEKRLGAARGFLVGDSEIAAPWRPTAAHAFTLVELIIVMTLLAVVAALAVPSLSRSMRQRNLDEEATRLLALTESGRDEAVSQGVPMVVWIDAKAQRYGVEPKAGFEADETRARDYAMNPDVQVEIDKAAVSGGVVEAIEFAPDGALTSASVDSVRLVDRFNSVINVSRTTDGWSYELVKEATK